MTQAVKSSKSMSKFSQHSAYKRLKTLAQHPVDLTQSGVLTPQRIEDYCVSGCGFKLLYGTQRVNEDVLDGLRELAVQADALNKMQQMQAGEVINRIEGYDSENRAVLHTAMRDLDGSSEAAKKANTEREKLKAFWDQHASSFTDLVMVGIGGSDLGPRALYLGLEKFHVPGRTCHFISNVDPDDAAAVLEGLNLKKTCVVVVSKSGTTIETLTNETILRERFKKAGIDPNKQFIAVTGEGSPMDDPGKYLGSFYIWDYVGGRYSATSMVGGVMLAYGVGYDNYEQLLQGAQAMDKAALEPDLKHNLPLTAALIGIWNRNFLGCPSVAVIPYSQALSRFPAHLQQCDMESNGKQIDRMGTPVDFATGPVIWGEPGTNGQHSFFQLLHQGTDVVPVEFIGFTQSQFGQDLEVQGTTSQEKLLSNLFAQSLALASGTKSDNPNKNFPGNRPNSVLLTDKLTPFTLGALLAYYEHKIAFQGFIWGINSFDQEGVQLGKVLANKISALFVEKRGGSKAEAFPLGSALLKHL